MRTKLAIALVWIAAIVFFNTIIGIFGIHAAIAGLALFVAVACVLATRNQWLEDRP